MAKLTYGEKAAIRMLGNPRTSDRRMVMVMDALAERDELRMTHILYLVVRYARLRAAREREGGDGGV
jgi:hypothetical protein